MKSLAVKSEPSDHFNPSLRCIVHSKPSSLTSHFSARAGSTTFVSGLTLVNPSFKKDEMVPATWLVISVVSIVDPSSFKFITICLLAELEPQLKITNAIIKAINNFFI